MIASVVLFLYAHRIAIGFAGLALGLWAMATDERYAHRINRKYLALGFLILLLSLPVSADGGDIIIADPCDICFETWPWWVCFARGCCWLIIAPCD